MDCWFSQQNYVPQIFYIQVKIASFSVALVRTQVPQGWPPQLRLEFPQEPVKKEIIIRLNKYVDKAGPDKYGSRRKFFFLAFLIF